MEYIYIICIALFGTYAIGSEGVMHVRIPADAALSTEFKVAFFPLHNALEEYVYFNNGGDRMGVKMQDINWLGEITTLRCNADEAEFSKHYKNVDVQKIHAAFNTHVKRVRMKRIIGIGLLFLSIYEWSQFWRTCIHIKSKK